MGLETMFIHTQCSNIILDKSHNISLGSGGPSSPQRMRNTVMVGKEDEPRRFAGCWRC